MMDCKKLLDALKQLKVETGSLACLGCGYEHDCAVHGCAIIREAIEQLTAQHLDPGEPLTLERLKEVPHGNIKDTTLQSICDRANEIASQSVCVGGNQWISVKDRTPEDEKPVLAYYGFYHEDDDLGARFIGTLTYFSHDPEPHWQHESTGLFVTHWMPLPEPPESDRNAATVEDATPERYQWLMGRFAKVE